MTATLAFTQASWDALRAALDFERETAWVLLARRVGDLGGDTTLLVREIVDVAENAYIIRESDKLSITPLGWLPAFARADAEDCVPVFVHTHPHGEATHSKLDFILDDELSRVADVRLEQGMYGSLVLGGSSDKPEFSARLKGREGAWVDVDRVRVVGQRLTLYAHDGATPLPAFDRQIRAFGEEGQRVLSQLRVGVIGAGGTGSAVTEQLVRLGVGYVVVIDPETLVDSNVTRVYGSTVGDVDRAKATIATDHAGRIGLGTNIRAVRGTILDEDTLRSLSHCDVIFGCTDDHAGRLVLTRLPQAMLQLLIDCGVVLDSRQGALFDIFARVSVVTPDTACLVCMGDVDPERARLEALSADERGALVREGYAPELDDPDPSVITFTTIAASLAVNELLSRVFGYSDEDPANRLVARIGSREVSKTRHLVQGSHRCGKRQLLAVGTRAPFLDYGWRHA